MPYFVLQQVGLHSYGQQLDSLFEVKGVREFGLQPTWQSHRNQLAPRYRTMQQIVPL